MRQCYLQVESLKDIGNKIFFCFRETIQNAIKNIGKMHLLIITGGVRSLKLKC